ncbi:hypothetical protein BDR26DRAFT_923847 [Obelidium mucronatum]|nr:hypothetical protein BDR26DRAFT_923847 [Obelidium mucronatum]
MPNQPTLQDLDDFPDDGDGLGVSQKAYRNHWATAAPAVVDSDDEQDPSDDDSEANKEDDPNDDLDRLHQSLGISDDEQEVDEEAEEEEMNGYEDVRDTKPVSEYCAVNCGKPHNQLTDREAHRIQAFFSSKTPAEHREWLATYLTIACEPVSMSAAPVNLGGKRKRVVTESRDQANVTYQLFGRKLCKTLWHNLTLVTQKGLKLALQKQRANPFSSKLGHHGLTGRRGNRLSYGMQRVARSIIRFASIYGYPNPGGTGAQILLHPETRRKHVFDSYLKDCGDLHVIPLSLKSFYQIWNKLCSHIKIMKPGSGFCDKCTQLRAIDTPAAKAALVDHRDAALVMKRKYRDDVKECRTSGVWCIQYDFAQKVLLPQSVRQQNCFYFMTGLKVEFCGVCCESARTQNNYLMVEGSAPNPKAAQKDRVMSVIFHDLKLHYSDHGAQELHAWADNCSGQNKNRWSMYFYLLLVIMKGVSRVKLNFMVAGHTKFGPDANFGVIKRDFHSSNIWTPAQFADCVNRSEQNTAIKDTDVSWWTWSAFLEQFFEGTVPKIMSMHEFEFPDDKLGTVRFRESDQDAWQEKNLLRPAVTVAVISGVMDSVVTPGFKMLCHFKMPADALSIDRLKQIDKIKRSILLTPEDRAQFAPHLDSSFTEYKESLVEKENERYLSTKKKCEEGRGSVAVKNVKLKGLEDQHILKMGEISKIWSNEVLVIAEEEE